jgi:hypothetical protein
MSEVERLESAIGLVRKGDLLGAAEFLEQSSGAMTRENAANCRRLATKPNSSLEQMLLHCLEQELGYARTFGF